MKNWKIKAGMVSFLCACLAISCSDPGANMKEPVTVATEAPNLNHVTTNLPKAEGYQTFMANCGICHSPRYVQDQPDLPAKTWTAIVTKMQKTFGAPVSDSSAKIIIDYLVAIKGKT